MKVLITGASGLLGSALAQRYLERGHELWCWQHRRPLPEALAGHVRSVHTVEDLSGHFDQVVNLAGASIAGGPWTSSRRNIIRESRVEFTRTLLTAAREHRYSIGHLISGSAVGYYGNNRQPVNEDAPPGTGFGAEFVSEWEAVARSFDDCIPHISLVRTGLVLSHRGGLLTPLTLPARFGLATRLGNGRQGQSWIHERDWLNAIDWIQEQTLTGPVNLTAPNPVSQDEFNATLARVLRRPYFMRMPGAPLRLALGEMASLVLEGQYVHPEKLQHSGFTFQFGYLEDALRQVLGRA
ncbi:TIGR01777 family oxidoreductase [Saccharospirillum salsuginis]|uniref:NAD-dependent dehydratase n=1 Tax=Saccharospirillum salsuginis TaxID=418750 RepID=A0A918KKX1_9GAMM|nr:TIGR01777 family oxidoreductase [Saccharospirillum salsuginis]GGX66824.1 NAD-dependent dehydratase [Saccharospirillum salsuginis]